MSDIESFGARVRRLRERSRFASQVELAEYLHIDRSTLSKWENNWTAPSRKLRSQLAELFGVTEFYLFHGYEEPVEPPRIFQPTPSAREPWSYPDADLLRIVHAGRREIERAEGFKRIVADA